MKVSPVTGLRLKFIVTVNSLLTDTSVRRTPGAGRGRFLVIFSITKLSIRRTTNTLKSSTDTCEVLNVTANYDLGKKNSCT